MPAIFHQPVDRRSFLRVTALGAAAVVSGCRSVSSRSRKGAEFHLALISDTHVPGDRENVYRGFKPWENLRRIVPEIGAANPEGVIHCGDVARLEGRPEDYAAVKELMSPLAARMPIYFAMGNHDDREQFQKVFPAVPGVAPWVKDRQVVVIDHAVARIVMLDSLFLTNKTPGFLGQAQREWLGKHLGAQRETPTVVFVHHTLGPADGELLDADRLFAALQPHRHVKAIFYGHSHVWERKERQGLRLVNLPAVGYNFSDEQPVGWVDARFRADGVALTLHAFGGKRAEDGRTFDVAWS